MAFGGAFVVLSVLRWQQPRQCDATYTAPETSHKIHSPEAASCDLAVPPHLAPGSGEASYDLPLRVEKRRAMPPSQATAVDDTEEEEEEESGAR